MAEMAESVPGHADIFSDYEKHLIKLTWMQITARYPKYPCVGHIIFNHIFRCSTEVMQIFSVNCSLEALDNNPTYLHHGEAFERFIGAAVDDLHRCTPAAFQAKLGSMLTGLGAKHARQSFAQRVSDKHWTLFGEAILSTVLVCYDEVRADAQLHGDETAQSSSCRTVDETSDTGAGLLPCVGFVCPCEESPSRESSDVTRALLHPQAADLPDLEDVKAAWDKFTNFLTTSIRLAFRRELSRVKQRKFTESLSKGRGRVVLVVSIIIAIIIGLLVLFGQFQFIW